MAIAMFLSTHEVGCKGGQVVERQGYFGILFFFFLTFPKVKMGKIIWWIIFLPEKFTFKSSILKVQVMLFPLGFSPIVWLLKIWLVFFVKEIRLSLRREIL